MGTSRVRIHHDLNSVGTIRYLYWATLHCNLFSTLAYLVQKIFYSAKLVLCKSRGDKFWVDVFLLCWLIGCSQLFPVGVTSHLFHLSMTRQHTSSFHTVHSTAAWPGLFEVYPIPLRVFTFIFIQSSLYISKQNTLIYYIEN